MGIRLYDKPRSVVAQHLSFYPYAIVLVVKNGRCLLPIFIRHSASYVVVVATTSFSGFQCNRQFDACVL